MKQQVIIFSAPSGSGKTTLVHYILEKFPQMEFSVSCTTRTARKNEKDGVDYYFISPTEFKKKIAAQAFVEYEEVYADNFYGTLKAEVERIWKKGNTVIFDVDVKGGISLKKYFGEKALSIFVMPPSVEELEQRLQRRNTESKATLSMRVEKAAQEMKEAPHFDKIVINDNLDKAKQDTEKLIIEFLNKN